MTSDFRDLLKVFNDSNVKYLLIGGHAVMHYTEPRYTKDLDVWVEASLENGDAVFRALKGFGAPLMNLAPRDFAEEGYFYSMGIPPARVDVMMSVAGLSFAEAWARREETVFNGVTIPVISRDDLITIKRAAGRARDLLDLQALEEHAPQRPKGRNRDIKP
jgi:hypothetical protein